MLTRRTAYALVGNHPDSTLVDVALDPETGKYAAFCYLLDGDREIDRLLVSTTPVFANRVAAVAFFNDLVAELQTSDEL